MAFLCEKHIKTCPFDATAHMFASVGICETCLNLGDNTNHYTKECKHRHTEPEKQDEVISDSAKKYIDERMQDFEDQLAELRDSYPTPKPRSLRDLIR